jgi:putative glutamine amidotransferase
MDASMSSENPDRPRVGIPYRTTNEEVTGQRVKYEMYTRAVQEAGGEPVEISLTLSRSELEHEARTLDAIVLPGSPADVNPALYHSQRHLKTAEDDEQRERTDFTLLEHAYGANKPVLAICYGIQSLNVFRGGSLIQDIATENPTKIQHPWENSKSGAPEPFHPVLIEPGTRLAQLAGAAEAQVNSSHHQAIREPGRDLRIAARAPDGIIEAVEGTGATNWIAGVQWHPERMPSDRLARSLFRELVVAARAAHVRT